MRQIVILLLAAKLFFALNGNANIIGDKPDPNDITTIDNYALKAKNEKDMRKYFCGKSIILGKEQSVRSKSGKICGKNNYIDGIILLICGGAPGDKRSDVEKFQTSECYDKIKKSDQFKQKSFNYQYSLKARCGSYVNIFAEQSLLKIIIGKCN